MASPKIVELTEQNFAQEIQGGTPILVDFWAQWCGPCRMVGPVLDELADELDGRVRIGKLNVDEHQGVAVQYQVSSIPTFILFQDGKIADRMMGAMPKAAFQSFLGRHVAA